MSAASSKSPGCVSRRRRSRTRATRRCPCCCRSSCWPPRRSISASTPNGPRASPARRQEPARRAAMTAALSPESLVLLAVLVPFVGALIIPLFHSRPNLRETVTLVTAGALCLIVFGLLGPVLDGARPEAARHRRRAGPRACLQGRAARACCSRSSPPRCGSSTRSTRSATCAPTRSRARPASMSASPSRSAARSASPSPRTCSRCSCSTRR